MSSSNDSNERVQMIIAEAIQVPEEVITSDLSFGDIPQWDSLGHMEIILKLEESYGLAIDTELIAKLVSVREIYQFLEENGHVQA